MNVLNSNTTKTGHVLVRSPHKCGHQPETFKCTGSRCKTCPFIQNATKILRPQQSINTNDRFTSILTNVIYCIICLLCKISYLGEAGRKLAYRLREHLRNVKKITKMLLNFQLPNDSTHNMTISSFSLHQGNTESHKNLEQSFIFQLGTLNPGLQNRFSFNYFIHMFKSPPLHQWHCSFTPYIKIFTTHNPFIRFDEELMLETSAFLSFLT